MKYIKIVLLILVLWTVIFLISCEAQFKYIEGNIYSETTLRGYSNLKEELEDIFTRDKAIEYAQNIFREGFGIIIDRDKLREEIKLTKVGEDFYWNITWEKEENEISTEQYYILINSNTRIVRSCGVINFNKNEDYYYNYYGSDEEIEDDDLKLALEISSHMIEKTNINIGDYVIEGLDRGNRRIMVLKSERKSYEFVVDISQRKLISFNSYGGGSDR